MKSIKRFKVFHEDALCQLIFMFCSVSLSPSTKGVKVFMKLGSVSMTLLKERFMEFKIHPITWY